MSIASKIGLEAQALAEQTGIAFGWEVGSLIASRPVCIAACLHCDGLVARAEMSGWPSDRQVAERVRTLQEIDVWQGFKLQALMMGCPHLLDHCRVVQGLVVPAEINAQYRDELAREIDRTQCDATGIAMGRRVDGGFVAGCCFCAYSYKVEPECFADMGEMVGAERAVTQFVPQMGKAALKRTCPHWFDYMRRYMTPPKGEAS